jgi:hypothetical protein
MKANFIKLLAGSLSAASFHKARSRHVGQPDFRRPPPAALGRLLIALLSVVAGVASAQFAQPGSLDITFNPGTGASGDIRCMVLQTNGQIIIGGFFATFNGSPHNCFARLNTDGSVDESFDSPTAHDAVNNVALQANGTILIGGNFTAWNGLPYNGVARLRSDGSVDTSFVPVALDPDGYMSLGYYLVRMVAGVAGQSSPSASVIWRCVQSKKLEMPVNMG